MDLLDKQLHDVYYSKDEGDALRAIDLLWEAQKKLWYTRMLMVDAFAGRPMPK